MAYNGLIQTIAVIVAVSMLGVAFANTNASSSNSSVPSSPLIGIFKTNQTTSQNTTLSTSVNTTSIPATTAQQVQTPSSNSGSAAPVLVTVGVAIVAAVAYGYYGGRKKGRRAGGA